MKRSQPNSVPRSAYLHPPARCMPSTATKALNRIWFMSASLRHQKTSRGLSNKNSTNTNPSSPKKHFFDHPSRMKAFRTSLGPFHDLGGGDLKPFQLALTLGSIVDSVPASGSIPSQRHFTTMTSPKPPSPNQALQRTPRSCHVGSLRSRRAISESSLSLSR